MSSPLLQRLTVLLVSPSGHPPTAGADLDDVDPAIDVVVADSPDRALERIEADRVHCVVCEHAPARVDGVAFVRAVREHDAELPVLVFPRDAGADWAERALAAGATDVVEATPESLSPAVLANRIRRFVGPLDGDGSTPATGEPGDSEQSAPATDEKPVADPVAKRGDVFADLNEGVAKLRRLAEKDAVAETAVGLATDVLDVPGVGVFLFDDEENRLRPAAITAELTDYYGGETAFGPGNSDSVTWRAFVGGETLLFDDVRSSDHTVNADTDARASAFAPLGDHGTFVASTTAVGAFSDSSRHLIELIADSVEQALDRIDRDDDLRGRDRRLREQADRLEFFDGLTELSRSVHGALVEATTREEIEAALVEHLVGTEWFEFAWIGTVDVDGDALAPRRWAGDGSQYLDDVSLELDECDVPACRTARESEVTAVPNVAENLDREGWERDALARDFHSVLSVPLSYEGVLFGVLTVYADRPDAFREPIASVLEGIARAAAFAVNASERRFCMLSNAVTELELRIDDPDDVLNVLAANVGSTVECLELSSLPDGSTKVLFSAPGVSAESVLATASGLVAVDSVSHVAGDDGHLFTAVVSREMVGSAVARAGGVLAGITADGTSLVVTANVYGTVDARTFVGRLERRYPNTTMLARRERDRSALTSGGFLDELETVLTDRQLEVLRTAYELGFFRSPRDATGQDVADRLGVSQPTVSHHLRRGQGELFSLLFDDR